MGKKKDRINKIPIAFQKNRGSLMFCLSIVQMACQTPCPTFK